MEYNIVDRIGPPTDGSDVLNWYPDPDQYILVSSLYGPGTMICWYLTTLSILLSWTLHPHKRASGSIDVDLIAVLTLPAVAVGHLIFLIRAVPPHLNTAPLPNFTEGFRKVAAIQAPLAVVETFEIFSMILIAVALRALCIRRAFLVAVVGLACFAISCNPIFINQSLPLRVRYPDIDVPVYISLSLTYDSPLSVPIFGILSTGSLICAAIVLTVLAASSARSLGLPRTRRHRNIAAAFLPLVFIALFIAFLPFWWAKLGTGYVELRKFSRDLLPHTACSLTDLDQSIAASTGASILGFGIYSIMKHAPSKWKRLRHIRGIDSEGIELQAMTQNA